MPHTNGRAFTLVDLLIAIAVALIALALLVPTLRSLRQSARTAQCAGNLRLIMQGVQLYAASNDGAIPGSPWTSAASLFTTDPAPNSSSLTPFDWMTPVADAIGLKYPVGGARRDRYVALVNHPLLRCPENNLPALPTGDSTFPVTRPPSYRTNLDFLLRSSRTLPFQPPRAPNVPSLLFSVPSAQLPLFYVPRLDKIGSLSDKVFLVEGAGLVDPSQDRITYPANPLEDHRFGGALATCRPYAQRPAPNEPANPLLRNNLADPTFSPNPLDPREDGLYLLAVARHGTQRADAPLTDYRLNVAFFDGHVDTLPILAALKPDYHSPKGTTIAVQTDLVYPRVIQRYFEGRENPRFVVP